MGWGDCQECIFVLPILKGSAGTECSQRGRIDPSLKTAQHHYQAKKRSEVTGANGVWQPTQIKIWNYFPHLCCVSCVSVFIGYEAQQDVFGLFLYNPNLILLA